MSPQNRIYITLSPRMRKALELCAALDGSTPTSYAAQLITSALTAEIEQHPALRERWIEMEREALLTTSWDTLPVPNLLKEARESEAAPRLKAMKGWLLAGSQPGYYEYGTDADELYQGKSSGFLRSKANEAEGFGTLMQMFKADTYRNKRLRFSASAKSQDVEGWAGLWMRVDGTDHKTLSFDNMQHRPIKGTNDWQLYAVTLDVPEASANIAFGFLMEGPGQVWFSDIRLTEVDEHTPVTSETPMQPDKPQNLDFAE